MNIVSKAVAAFATIVIVSLTLAGSSASAVELFTASIDQVVRGAEGDVIEVATIEVPADSVGLSCSVVGETENQESVHPGNDLLIVGSVTTLTIPNFEDEGFIRHQAGELDSLPSVIRVFVRLGPDGVSSGGLRISIECDEPDGGTGGETETPSTTIATTETTTTEATTTTTGAPTETTVAAAPSTTAPESGAVGGSGDSGDQGDLAATGAGTTTILVITGGLLIAAGIGLQRRSRQLV